MKEKYRPEDYRIFNYKWNNGKLDVYQDVDLSRMDLIKLPFNFGVVTGNFIIRESNLKSLVGSPDEVSGDFDCSMNRLETLEGCPNKIDGSFKCSYNRLETLKYHPKIIGKKFICSHNRLTSLKDGPIETNGSFCCNANLLSSLDGCPRIIKNGCFNFRRNRIKSIKNIKVLPICNLIYSDFSFPIEEIREIIRLNQNKDKIRIKIKNL